MPATVARELRGPSDPGPIRAGTVSRHGFTLLENKLLTRRRTEVDGRHVSVTIRGTGGDARQVAGRWQAGGSRQVASRGGPPARPRQGRGGPRQGIVGGLWGAAEHTELYVVCSPRDRYGFTVVMSTVH